MTVPLLLVLEPLLAEIFLFLGQFCTSLGCQGRASTAQMGRLAAHLVLKLATVTLERGPSIPGDKDCIEDDHDPSKLSICSWITW